MATKFQLIHYIDKIKASSKYTLYEGRRIKRYDVPGTPEYAEMKKARHDLGVLILGDKVDD